MLLLLDGGVYHKRFDDENIYWFCYHIKQTLPVVIFICSMNVNNVETSLRK